MPEKRVTKEATAKAPAPHYYSAVGRRKRAVAQVRLYAKGKGDVAINSKKLDVYFPDLDLQQIVLAPLVLLGKDKEFGVSVLVRGGGKHGQAESVRLGIARALEEFDKDVRKTLKVAGFLKRDPRKRERKKPGLKRARGAPQWSKR